MSRGVTLAIIVICRGVCLNNGIAQFNCGEHQTLRVVRRSVLAEGRVCFHVSVGLSYYV